MNSTIFKQLSHLHYEIVEVLLNKILDEVDTQCKTNRLITNIINRKDDDGKYIFHGEHLRIINEEADRFNLKTPCFYETIDKAIENLSKIKIDCDNKIISIRIEKVLSCSTND